MVEIIKKIKTLDLKTAKELLRVQKEAYKIEAELLNYYDLPPLRQKVEDLLNTTEEFFIYKLNNQIYGVISFERKKDYIDICKLFVSPQYINKGIGSKLLKKLEVKNYENIKYLIVQTGLENKPAINFYKKHNFKLVQVKMIDKLSIACFKKSLMKKSDN